MGYSPKGCKESDTTEAIQQKHAHDAKRNVTEDGSFQIKVTIERVTGRKARGLQIEEIACKCQTFLSLLSGRRKQTSNIFFFPSLYKFKRRLLLKYCVAIMTPGFT